MTAGDTNPDLETRNMGQAAIPATRRRRFSTLRTIWALILREMATTYGRSPGGYLWAVLEPVGAIALYTLVIAVGLRIRNPALGTVFMLFFATGQLPFSFYQKTGRKVATSIKFSRQLLRYPAVRYTDAIIARFILDTMTNLMVFYLVMTGIHLIFDTTLILDVPAILLSLTMASMLGLGIGTLNCYLFNAFPVWEQVWTIINRPLFLLSTIFYIFEDIPWRYQNLMWYNPIIHIVGLMRRGFYPTYDARYVSPTYVFAIALITLFFGLLLLNRHHRDILNN